MENNYFNPILKTLGESIRQFSARLMRERQEEVGLYQSRWGDIEDGFLSESNDGFTIGQYRISETISLRSMIAIAASGVGKTSTICINCGLSAIGASYIFHSEADDIFNKISGYLHSKNYEIFKLDLINPSESHRFNPFENFTKENVGNHAQIIIGSHEKSDPFWSDSAQSLLVVLFLLQLQMPKEFQTLAHTKKILNWMGGNSQTVDDLFARYADAETMDKYKYLISISEKTFSSILATCQAAMRIFDDPHVIEITSSNEIPLNLRDKRRAVFLKNSLHSSNYISMILGLYLFQTSAELMKSEPSPNARPVYAILDESALLARAMPNLAIYMTQSRKYKYSYLLICQSINLLKKYPDFETIIASCYTKIYYNSLDNTTSEYVSQALGRTTITDGQGREKVVPLYTPEQVRQMLPNQVIIMSGNKSAYKVILKPYFKQFILNMRSKLPSVDIAIERRKLLK